MTDIFSLKDFKMPEGFIWGSSTAGHQIEGNNIYSGHWTMEIEKSKTVEGYVPSGLACNHYELYEKDIKLFEGKNENNYKSLLHVS